MATTEQKTALRDQMLTVFTKIYSELQAVKANTDASTLQGKTLAQITSDIAVLIQGSTSATVKDIEDITTSLTTQLGSLNATSVGLGDVVNAGFVTTADPANYAATVTQQYVDPKVVWQIVSDHWAAQAGMAADTLDTINEISTALQNDPNVITAIQNNMATKASKTELSDAVATLNATIAGLMATDAEVLAGTATDKVMSVKQTIDAINAGAETVSSADTTNMTSLFTEMGQILDGTHASQAQV